ncbi:CS1 type fimbrial major subunit [Yersinia pekkanenii]|uniref:Alpha-related fimbriae minor subunit 1 n=1 Tax=Yersinia pekkanenii TaxID=1288385 RepID=A0A0T9NQL0_9GAMM|nr:CS1 type fimbrial major subunit [Yersinia pekkanenii]CNH25141.1 alpha-related fimbriae minor subunit 1 [Yersinia pekkanenii]CRY67206.1 alpha-related fimbriae minor subunit 1 [Yersinia pekkanenii]
MKKTLLSIITMAVFSSSSAYAQPLNKDIHVETEIHSKVSLSKANDSELNNITLSYDTNNNDGTHTHQENIKIKASGANKVKIALLEDFSLKNGKNDTFTHHLITIDGKQLQSPVNILGGARQLNQFFDLINNEAILELKISAKEPQGAVAGEIYSGIAKFVIEEHI